MYNRLLFDLDGTLTDSFDGVANSVIYALERMGYRDIDKSALRPFLGPPLTYSFKTIYGMTDAQADEAVRLYREYYRPHGWLENSVYDGVPQMLSALKSAGKHLAVATSKPEQFAKKILDRFGLAEHFEFIGGATLDDSRSEKPAVVKYTLDSFCPDKTAALMIGDRKYDVEGAKLNGIAAMGVLYGYGDRQELVSAGATLLAETPADIARIILQDD